MSGTSGTRAGEHLARWPACLLAVLVIHVTGGLLFLSHSGKPAMQTSAPVVMLELAPVTSPPRAETPPEQPEPPPPEAGEPPPPEPAAPPTEVPLPDPPPPNPGVLPTEVPPAESPPEPVPDPTPPRAAPAVPLPPKSPPPPRHRTDLARRAAPVETPPAIAQPAPSPARTASSPTVPSADWQSRLLAHLTRFKRYPPTAQMRREQGVALLRFSMTPAGEVSAFRLERSSGHPLLDQETLELVRRAQPLPALPPDMPQRTIELVVPLRYELR